MATLAELIIQVRAATMVPSAMVSDANLTTWINEGLYKVAASDRWPWLEASSNFTTTAGTQAYAISGIASGAVDRIAAIYSNTKRRRLVQVSAAQALEAYGGDMPSGAHADSFYIWAGSIYLLPVPDTSSVQYNLYYYKAPTALTTNTSPEFDAVFHRVLAHYAEMRLWQFEEDTQKAQAAEVQFYRVLTEMRGWYRDIAEDEPWAVGVPQSRRATRSNTPFLDGL